MPRLTFGQSCLLAVLISLIGIPLSIAVTYAQYDLLSINLKLALRYFDAWPWFRGTLVVTLLCFLWPFWSLWFSRGDKERYDRQLYEWFVISWFVPLFMYPGTRRLEVWSDGKLVTAATLMVIIQNVTLWIFAHSLWRESIKNADVAA